MPVRARAVVAAAKAIKASASVVLYHKLELLAPHAVSILLLQSKISFLSPAHHLSCMTILLSQPHLIIKRCKKNTPLTEGEVIYVDGSSKRSLDRTNKTGYAVVTADKVIEAKALPPHFSAQTAELIALT